MRMERQVNYSCMISVWMIPELNEMHLNQWWESEERNGVERLSHVQSSPVCFQVLGKGVFWS